jgi:hypothetical protein
MPKVISHEVLCFVELFVEIFLYALQFSLCTLDAYKLEARGNMSSLDKRIPYVSQKYHPIAATPHNTVTHTKTCILDDTS